ncbi:protein adenylyltransferase SelO family protein [Vibrio sp. vnigr-6D03]|uniref:protein adenylyltransferase SelO family protein n=1 Tax=Vibrio sp. vnigr-6D03 TaxID=2058088 RepID=UPI0011AFCDA5|nr:protein adenylyltransferase SelO family protein [Vibrio sp. vnigr-6D03]
MIEKMSNLPTTSLVPFVTSKVNGASVAWKNLDLIRDYGLDHIDDIDTWLLDNYSFSTLPVDESNLQADQSTFYAERYGGQLLAGNGGGGRAGLKGDFQCKGIGPTPLIGSITPDHYRTGMASLTEMLNEVLWGEVCHAMLPHGAVRCLAIIDIGNILEGEERYAIAVRENEVRMGHFELSPYFEPRGNEPLLSESLRVKAALDQFEDICSSIYADSSTPEAILDSIVKRFAEQLACARLFRICHGSITSSNIGISGKYLDFGTISSLGSYENISTSMGNPGFLYEYRNIVSSISGFIDTINWYRRDINISSSDYVEKFIYHFEKQCHMRFCSIFGFEYTEQSPLGSTYERLSKKIYRYLTMGGAKEKYGVTYHNEGDGFHTVDTLFGKLADRDFDSSSLEHSMFLDIKDILAESGGDYDEYIRQRFCFYNESNLNMDYLHYDLIRQDISEMIKGDNIYAVFSEYVDDKIKRSNKIKEYYIV